LLVNYERGQETALEESRGLARVGILVISDRASRGEYDDKSGKAINDFLNKAVKSNWIAIVKIIPDGVDSVAKAENRRLARPCATDCLASRSSACAMRCSKIEPGDTVKFAATDKGHNAESIKGMLPADAAPFVGKNGEDVTVTFDKPGVYGVKCLPHYGMGMVALIVVGMPGNLAEAKAVPQVGKAKQVFAALFENLPTQAAAVK